MEVHISTNRKTKNTDQPNDPIELPCPGIFLPVIQAEYEQEREISDRIDAKAMALLTVIIALITVYIPIFPVTELVKLYSKNRSCYTLPVICAFFILLGITALVLSIICATKLIGIYKTKGYKAVDIKYFNTNQKLANTCAEEFQLDLIDHYQVIILHNSNVNMQKAKKINKQFYFVVFIFILLTVSAIGAIVCTGF